MKRIINKKEPSNCSYQLAAVLFFFYSMSTFSYMKGGFTTNRITEEITIEQLDTFIADNPHNKIIEFLHTLDRNADKTVYDAVKGTLPCIKVHAMFEKYGRKEYFKSFTSLFYYDLDYSVNREKFLAEHGNKIYRLGHSVGGKGLFFLVKIKNTEILTLKNFQFYHDQIKNTFFPDVQIDEDAKGYARNFIIPMDKNLFVNNDSDQLELIKCSNEFTELIKDKKIECTPPGMKKKEERKEDKGNCTLESFWDDIVWEQMPVVKDAIVDIKKQEYLKLFIPKMPDGKKREIFKNIIWTLMYLNPDFGIDKIIAFMKFVNVPRFTCGTPMIDKDFYPYVQNAFDNYDVLKVKFKTKRIWFNPNLKWTRLEKSNYAAVINGNIKSETSLTDIIEAIELFLDKNFIINKKAIANHIDKSRVTVTKYWTEAISYFTELGIDIKCTTPYIGKKRRRKEDRGTCTLINQTDSIQKQKIEIASHSIAPVIALDKPQQPLISLSRLKEITNNAALKAGVLSATAPTVAEEMKPQTQAIIEFDDDDIQDENDGKWDAIVEEISEEDDAEFARYDKEVADTFYIQTGWTWNALCCWADGYGLHDRDLLQRALDKNNVVVDEEEKPFNPLDPSNGFPTFDPMEKKRIFRLVQAAELFLQRCSYPELLTWAQQNEIKDYDQFKAALLMVAVDIETRKEWEYDRV